MGNRIICVIHRRNDKILHVVETLERMGNEVKILYWDDYIHVCSYWKKKIYKLGFKQGEKDYLLKWKKNFYMLVEKFSPTHILFVNYAVGFLNTEDLRAVKGKIKLISWFVDSIRRMEDLSAYYPLMDNVWVFEEVDISILREACNVEAKFIAVGYNSDYEYREESKHKTMDVCFVGAPYKNRLEILETIIGKSNSKITISGPFYEEKYFWKNIHLRENIQRFILAYIMDSFHRRKLQKYISRVEYA
jgi:spore maturation protein CgeB